MLVTPCVTHPAVAAVLLLVPPLHCCVPPAVPSLPSHQTLRRSYPNVPAPVESYVTRWANDPWARGSYSYYAVGNPKSITGE